MNLDKTFCTGRQADGNWCTRMANCERHRDRLTEWANMRPENMAMLEHLPLSVSSFNQQADGYCEYFLNMVPK